MAYTIGALKTTEVRPEPTITLEPMTYETTEVRVEQPVITPAPKSTVQHSVEETAVITPAPSKVAIHQVIIEPEKPIEPAPPQMAQHTVEMIPDAGTGETEYQPSDKPSLLPFAIAAGAVALIALT